MLVRIFIIDINLFFVNFFLKKKLIGNGNRNDTTSIFSFFLDFLLYFIEEFKYSKYEINGFFVPTGFMNWLTDFFFEIYSIRKRSKLATLCVQIFNYIFIFDFLSLITVIDDLF